jgi:hypothetical protein
MLKGPADYINFTITGLAALMKPPGKIRLAFVIRPSIDERDERVMWAEVPELGVASAASWSILCCTARRPGGLDVEKKSAYIGAASRQLRLVRGWSKLPRAVG